MQKAGRHSDRQVRDRTGQPDEAGTFQQIFVTQSLVADVFDVDVGALRGRGKAAAVARARQAAMYLAHVVLGFTPTDVGRAFNRHRTTVTHACSTIEDCRDDDRFNMLLDALEAYLEQGVLQRRSGRDRGGHGGPDQGSALPLLGFAA